MVEGGGGPESGLGSKPTTSYESAGGRQRFIVELRPGETTIVSWKKLLKDATSGKLNGSGPLVQGPSPEAHNTVPAPAPAPAPAPPSGAASLKQSAENGAKDSQAQPGSNRLSNVIERIERMYAGDGSSDEEDVVLDDVPDEDEYDTEDSFIDDTELDDYFQVDNSAIKHDGFFVNRGKLERVEPSSLPNQQPKKRRRKDLAKGPGGSGDRPNPREHVKIGNKGKKAASMIERTTSESHIVQLPNVQGEDVQVQALTNAAEVSSKKKTAAGPSELSNGDGIRQEKDIDQQRTGVVSSKNHGNKLKEGYELLDTSTQRSNDKSLYSSKTQSGMPVNRGDEVSQSIPRKEKGGVLERPDLNVPASGSSLQTVKAPVLQRKEGSSVRPKSTMLDKAIRELEKTVAESRPPSLEVQDADNPSQAVKRRLTPEIKQKLAKVARLAQASHGKISKDVTNRLMSIVGHLMQLRTLKRNLKIMAIMGLSAKQEKDDRVQHIKQEVAEMVKVRLPLVKPKVLEQQTASSDDFQETGPEEKESLKRKYRIDSALEDKICDLYDLYVERFEEDPGPPVRRLYEELAALWPSGIMDTHGIKRAICRAKDRRKALSSQQKDQEKMRKKKKLAPKADEPVRGEASNVAEPSHKQETLVPNSRDYGSSLINKSVPGAAVANAPVRVPVTVANGPTVDKLKQEKAKGHSSIPVDVGTTDVLSKKKLKRKQETVFVEGFRHEKSASTQGEERHKHHKQVATAIPVKPNLQPAVPPSVQPS
ncbi:wound-responsive family protein [Forsythia ovata]|uniref:Wound-responsive family protein n=1 Tax=Forsythia ovata TaxID=205694 RepID=A0ABD1VMJ0_9LAMI